MKVPSSPEPLSSPSERRPGAPAPAVGAGVDARIHALLSRCAEAARRGAEQGPASARVAAR